jgi:excisionase family DNA binding protein
MPPQLEDLALFLASHVRQCQDVSPVDGGIARLDSLAVPSRLLLTKREAAEQLGVSVRTIERLISAGRLPLVHVEGAARVRVADLETYVQGLEADDRSNPSHAE